MTTSEWRTLDNNLSHSDNNLSDIESDGGGRSRLHMEHIFLRGTFACQKISLNVQKTRNVHMNSGWKMLSI